MIVDTSALVAVLRREPHWQRLLDALLSEQGFLPAPVIVEFRRVTSGQNNTRNSAATDLLAEISDAFVATLSFDAAAAEAAVEANARFGSGGRLGGLLNMLDLMVYGVSKTRNLPILCTGNDFLATDAAIHPASRRS